MSEFNRFDLEFIHTGEGVGSRSGFYFSPSEIGAFSHVKSISKGRGGWVYEVDVGDALIVDAGLEIDMQSVEFSQIWDNFPVSISVERGGDWLSAGVVSRYGDDLKGEDKFLRLLASGGVDGIFDFERGMQDGVHGGPVLLMINFDKIKIISAKKC